MHKLSNSASLYLPSFTNTFDYVDNGARNRTWTGTTRSHGFLGPMRTAYFAIRAYKGITLVFYIYGYRYSYFAAVVFCQILQHNGSNKKRGVVYLHSVYGLHYDSIGVDFSRSTEMLIHNFHKPLRRRDI